MVVNESEENFLYVLQEYEKMCQEKGLTHQTYPSHNIYGYFRKLLKVVYRNTWYGKITIILNAALCVH